MPKKSSAMQQDQLHLKGQHGPKISGHEVDFGTFSTIDAEGQSGYRPWITKLNKHAGPKGVDASVLEVAFSEIASLFIRPGLTPPAKVVLDGDRVVGVTSENFNAQIRRLQAQEECFAFDPVKWTYQPISKMTLSSEKQDAERASLDDRAPYMDQASKGKHLEERFALKKAQKGVNFLVDMPPKETPKFFTKLMERHKAGEVEVDMDSLASILTASYTLEEDDLHKGNIGFYVTDNPEGKKKFTFFKIDHDLMFIDSIMSQKDMRLANILYSKDSFKFSVRDLEGFPDLKDSGNHYWPTKKQLMVAGDKAYKDADERAAFADLKNDPAFNNAKWKSFLKYSLMPTALIEKSLVTHLDPVKDADKINMIKNSIGSRMSQLREALSNSPKFVEYLKEHGKEAKDSIKSEISEYLKNSSMPQKDKDDLLRQVDKNFEQFALFSSIENVTPLQKALVLDSYQFSHSVKPTRDEINFVQSEFEEYLNNDDKVSAFKYACIITDLVKKSNLTPTEKVECLKDVVAFKKEYLNPESIKTLDDFKNAADLIRKSYLPLKQQKNELLALLKDSKMPPGELLKLKEQLSKKEPDDPALKFINQLRSELWLVRKIKGTFGKTSTTEMMLKELDSQILKAEQAPEQDCSRKFKEFKDRNNTITKNRQIFSPSPDTECYF